MTHIAGVPRPEGTDIVYLTDGETLRGEVTNTDLTIHTSYGSVQLETSWLAGVSISHKPDQLDRVKTINQNQFSGFINDSISFRSEAGEQVQLSKFKVDRIVFRQRANEADRIATGRFLVLKNGDLISGQPVEWDPRIKPGDSTVTANLDDIELVEFVEGSRNLQILLRNGGDISGSFEEDALEMKSDVGPVLLLPLSALQSLHARTISVPLVVRRKFGGGAPMAADTSTEPPAPTPDGMVWIPPGRFLMGSYPSEQGHSSDEDPPTEVVITHGFWMGQHELTQAEYFAVMEFNPSAYQGQDDFPVERVTWREAVAYCEKRTVAERESGQLPSDFVYRLPTEAEWEYSCRAGSATRFHFGDDPDGTELLAYAWFINNSDSSPHAVGQLRPNAWGLYDMHGNVWEWCLDIWQDAYPGGTAEDLFNATDGWLRVARGGSWLYDTSFARSANRDSYGPDNRCSDIGFRIVLAHPVQ